MLGTAVLTMVESSVCMKNAAATSQIRPRIRAMPSGELAWGSERTARPSGNQRKRDILAAHAKPGSVTRNRCREESVGNGRPRFRAGEPVREQGVSGLRHRGGVRRRPDTGGVRTCTVGSTRVATKLSTTRRDRNSPDPDTATSIFRAPFAGKLRSMALRTASRIAGIVHRGFPRGRMLREPKLHGGYTAPTSTQSKP